ncbi:unnamed protein product, partial [Brugia timori]
MLNEARLVVWMVWLGWVAVGKWSLVVLHKLVGL